MRELLNKILSLREDISNITKLSNEKAYEYCELAIKIANIEEKIEKITLTKCVLEEKIFDFKLKKGMLFTISIGILLSILYFTGVIVTCLDNLTLGTILFALIGTPAFGISISFMLSSFLSHSKKFTCYLIKKNSSLKEMNDNLNNLIIKSKILENNLNDVKNQKEKLTNIIINNEDIIESKKEELSKLEEEYFHYIMNNPVTNGTIYTLSSAAKKRTLTRGNNYR